MKIAHVIPGLGKGGAERVVVDLANAMAGRGHEVAILTGSHTPRGVHAGEVAKGVELRVVDEEGLRFGQYAGLPSWIRRNRQWLLSHDVLHCHLTFGAALGMVASLLRKADRPPAIVATYHSAGMPIPVGLRAAHAAMLRFGDAAAFMAEDSYWHSFRMRNPQLLTPIIENGVRAELAAPPEGAVRSYREKAGIPENALVVGTIGRLKAERRPDRIVAAFASAFAGSGRDVRLLVAGEGPERKLLEAQAARLGLGARVHMPGLVTDPAVALANIDLYVTLNVGSVTGVAALEAAAFGLPVIGFQMIASRPESDADWIWSSPSTDRLGERIRELAGDPARRAVLAERQKQYVATHLGVDTMVNAYLRLYAQALSRRRIKSIGPLGNAS